MTIRWYRAYVGTISDDKLAEASAVSGASLCVVYTTWHAILENAAQEEGGRFTTTARRVAALIREQASTVEAVFAALREIGMIGDDTVTAWSVRQYENVTSRDRTRAYRDRLKSKESVTETENDVTVTPCDVTERHCNAPDTDTDTERKKERGARKRALPDDWAPSDETWGRAIKAVGRDRAQHELVKFRQHAKATGRAMKDWQATFDMWITRSKEGFGGQPPIRREGGPSRISTAI